MTKKILRKALELMARYYRPAHKKGDMYEDMIAGDIAFFIRRAKEAVCKK